VAALTKAETVRTIPWWEPQLAGREEALIGEVLRSGYLNEGDVTTRFEERLAELLGVRHVVATTSGTSAIFLALAALGIGQGDEVIVPDVTFIATANAVMLAGARPVLVDVDADTLNIAPESVERAITPRTKAVVPVHVSGRACDMPRLIAIAQRKGIAVIEDAAEGFLSVRDGRTLGTLADAGCFSFSPNKTITTGQGGAIAINDHALATRLRALKDQGRPTRGTGGNDVHASVGYNFKLTNLQAAVGLAQLDAVMDRLARQRQIHRQYVAGLANVTGIRLLPFRVDEGETPQWTDALADRRDELAHYLTERAIGCRPFWYPIHTQTPYRLPDDHFPDSTMLMRRAIWLPSAFTLTDDDIALVCEHIRAFYGAARQAV
jgi:perosamine synthetase